METMSGRLKWCRRRFGWTQRDLARESGVGLATVRRVEQEQFARGWRRWNGSPRRCASAAWLAFGDEPMAMLGDTTADERRRAQNRVGYRGSPGQVVGDGGPWYRDEAANGRSTRGSSARRGRRHDRARQARSVLPPRLERGAGLQPRRPGAGDAAMCRQHGWEIVARYRDEGKSARSDSIAKRPAFRQLLADAEARRFDVLVVHKMDRFARNMRVALDAFARLAHAGVRFVSASENTDWDSPAGGSSATCCCRCRSGSPTTRRGDEEGQGRRKAQGRHNGLLPFGVTTNAAGVPVLDAHARSCLVATRSEIVPGEGLVLAFELAAAGKSDREIAQALTRAGYRTSGNRGANPCTKDTVRVILRNRFYVGELPDGAGGWVRASTAPNPPRRSSSGRNGRARRTPRAPRWTASVRSPWALSGLATCGGCGRNITAEGKGRARGAGPDPRQRLRSAVVRRRTGRGPGGGAAGGVRDPRGPAGPAAERVAPVAERGRRHATARIGIRRKLDRLRELYLDGDLDKGRTRPGKRPCTTNWPPCRRRATQTATRGSAWSVSWRTWRAPGGRRRRRTEQAGARPLRRRRRRQQDGRGGGATAGAASLFRCQPTRRIMHRRKRRGSARAVPTGFPRTPSSSRRPGSPSALHGTASRQAFA